MLYQDFSSEFEKWVRVLYNVDAYSPPPDGDELDYMYAKLSEIRLYGSFEAWNLANRTLHDLNAWLMGSHEPDAEGPRWARESHDEFIGQVRIDLGAESPLQPQPRIERLADWVSMRWPDRLRRLQRDDLAEEDR